MAKLLATEGRSAAGYGSDDDDNDDGNEDDDHGNQSFASPFTLPPKSKVTDDIENDEDADL